VPPTTVPPLAPPPATTEPPAPDRPNGLPLALIVGNTTPDDDANALTHHLDATGWTTTFIDDDDVTATHMATADLVIITPAAGTDGADIPDSADTPVLASGTDAMNALHLTTKEMQRNNVANRIDGQSTRVLDERSAIAEVHTVDGAEIFSTYGRNPATFGIPTGTRLADRSTADTAYAGFFAGQGSIALLNTNGWNLFDTTLNWLIAHG
jgi:hypothetical protein